MIREIVVSFHNVCVSLLWLIFTFWIELPSGLNLEELKTKTSIELMSS